MSSTYLDFVRVVVDGDIDQVARRLAGSPALAVMSSDVGATRQESSAFLFVDIAHYFYAGDTALHMAAAAFRRQVATLLVDHGADSRAKNRRGAEPLHYAADAHRWDPTAQAETIEYLISVGADPNASDRSGVSPLHRAVRTRSLAAVRALVDGGADSRRPNKAGSTPLHLAVQTTGRSGSGSPQTIALVLSGIRTLKEPPTMAAAMAATWCDAGFTPGRFGGARPIDRATRHEEVVEVAIVWRRRTSPCSRRPAGAACPRVRSRSPAAANAGRWAGEGAGYGEHLVRVTMTYE